MGARASKRMNVPCAGSVAMPVGEEARFGSRPAVAVGVVPVAMPAMRVVVHVMPVVESVGVPRVMRSARRRGVVGVRDREEGHERPECEPRGEVAVVVPVVMPPPRLGGAGKGEHGHERESEYGSPHRASSRTGAGERQGTAMPPPGWLAGSPAF